MVVECCDVQTGGMTLMCRDYDTLMEAQELARSEGLGMWNRDEAAIRNSVRDCCFPDEVGSGALSLQWGDSLCVCICVSACVPVYLSVCVGACVSVYRTYNTHLTKHSLTGHNCWAV